MAEAKEGTLLWEPSEEFKESANISRYMRWLEENRGLSFEGYEELWEWSVADLEEFWASIWEYFDVQASKPYSEVLASRQMPGTEWFPGAELNYAEHVFRNANERPEEPAIMHQSEVRSLGTVTWQGLHDRVAALAAGLRSLGGERGDRVVAYVPNTPEALIAFLATASLGAVWSSCSPDFGAESVVDRFAQIEPKVLIAVEERAGDSEEPGRWMRVFVEATFAPEEGELGTSAGLLAAVANDPKLLEPVRESFGSWQSRIEDDGLDPALSTLVRLAADGLWMADLFGLAPPEGELREQVTRKMLEMTRNPSEGS